METLSPPSLDPESLGRRNRLVSSVEIADGLIGVRRHPCAAGPIVLDVDEGDTLQSIDEVATVLRAYGGDPTTAPDDAFDHCDHLEVEAMWAAWDERLYTGASWSVEWWERRRAREHLGMPHQGGARRGSIGGWSPSSRRRLIRKCAEVDWSAFVEAVDDGRPVALVTLTLPAMWDTWCPNAKAFKRLLKLLWARLERKYGNIQSVWKAEMQRRGAPHCHLYIVVPGDLDEFRLWIGTTWNTLVCGQGSRATVNFDGPLGLDVDELRDVVDAALARDRRNHLLVSLHPSTVDVSWGEHCGSPADISHYFAKHGAAGGHGRKEYQHELPPGWETIGRWWGSRRMTSTIVQRPIRDGDGLQLLRALRRWQGSGNQSRLKDRLRLHGALDQTDDMKRRRAATRSFIRGRRNAQELRWLAVNNAPGLAVQLLRVLDPACGPRPGRLLP